jgi:hypothetical protein
LRTSNSAVARESIEDAIGLTKELLMPAVFQVRLYRRCLDGSQPIVTERCEAFCLHNLPYFMMALDVECDLIAGIRIGHWIAIEDIRYQNRATNRTLALEWAPERKVKHLRTQVTHFVSPWWNFALISAESL